MVISSAYSNKINNFITLAYIFPKIPIIMRFSAYQKRNYILKLDIPDEIVLKNKRISNIQSLNRQILMISK